MFGKIVPWVCAFGIVGCAERASIASMGEPWIEGCADLVDGSGFAAVDSAGIEIALNTAPAWQASEQLNLGAEAEVVIGVVAGDPAYEFGSIVATTALSDGRIVVVDGQAAELRMFTRDGSHVRTVGGRGSGPGEYMYISGLNRTLGDTLWVNDGAIRRITRLDPRLEVIETIPLAPISWTSTNAETGRPTSGSTAQRIRAVLDGGALLTSYRLGVMRSGDITYQVWRDSSILRRVDLRSGESDSLALILGGEHYEAKVDRWLAFGDPPFARVGSFVGARDRYYYGLGNRFEVEEYATDGTLVRLIRVCEQPDPITPAVLDRAIEERLAGMAEDELEYQEPALRMLPRPASAPAYLEMQVDRADRLWVRDFTLPDAAQRWRVFERSGRWLGEVDVPAGLEVHDIGPDYVLGTRLDSLGVAAVQLYRMRTGAPES